MTKERFTSPVGRLVQGTVDEPQTKDAQGNLRVVKTGPNAGQPNPQYYIGVAFAKTDPLWPAFHNVLLAKAALDFPNLFPQGPTGPCVHPQFAFKVIDGDGLDTSGKSNADKEGFAGHWVVRFASSYPPRCFHAGRHAANEQIQEKGAIKRGYYVRVAGTVEGNGNAQRPGLYVNLDMVELSAYGPEIVSGPDASTAFGGAPVALPPGASATPVTPPAAPASASPVPGAPAAPPAPYGGYMGTGNGAPAASSLASAATPPTLPTASPTSPPPAPSAPPTTARAMLPAANGATYESMIAAGWTDDTLRAHGMMA